MRSDIFDMPSAAGAAASRANNNRPSAAENLANSRKNYGDRQYGIKPQSLEPSDKAKSVARVKTFVKDTRCPRMYDKMRVFGRAIAAARPHELLDIQICRQSM